MAFPNVSDIVATTIQSRSRKLADNVTKNTALLTKLNARGNVKPITGGNVIYQELTFAENANAGWYSGYDLLPTAAQDVITAAEYSIKQLACPVVISGLEELQNAGKEQFIDLMEGRIGAAEATMMNRLSGGLYSDGSGYGGKELTGLNAAVPITTNSNTYGGIDRSNASFAFWRTTTVDVNTYASADNPVQAAMNALWAQLVVNSERPDLIPMDSVMWGNYVAELQAQQRFMSPNVGEFGFASIKFMDADVVLDGGIGGFCPSKTAFMLNTKFIFLRPHAQRNMVPLSPNKRAPINQDAEIQILAWAGNLTCSGSRYQGRLIDTRV